jgi:nucleotide-binding universal stress UspA family protein
MGGIIMFKRIIIASETSPDSLNVLTCLQGLRKLGAEECLLLQCMLPQNQSVALLSAVILEENLRQQQEMLVEQGFRVETRKVTGNIGKEVNRIAVEEDFSVIVAGIPEFTMMGEVFYGGIAHEVIQHARKPVLLIRITESPDEALSCAAGDYSLFGHVLFPTDFSENAGIAFEYVKKMVADGARKVTLAHVQDQVRLNPHLAYRLEKYNVIDTPKEVTEAKTIAAQRLEKYNLIDNKRLEDMKKVLQENGDAEVDICILYGSPAAEILKKVRELKIPIVVMGSQGRGFVKELFLGSVSNNIARHSSASVLLIPAKR